MARKSKFTPDQSVQPGLFDGLEVPLSPGVPRRGRTIVPDVPATAPEVHPDIHDFVVKMRGNLPAQDDKGEAAVEPIESLRRRETLFFISFGSGSSGNCAYIGSRNEGVLIDAGVEPEIVEQAMNGAGLSMECVKGILLTHDHSDHVRYVYNILRKRKDVAVYCTPKALNGLLRRHSISRRIKDYHRPVYKEFAFTVGEATITPFDTSHDGTDNAGFYIERGANTFAVATDLGCVTPRVDYYMRRARFVMIESNYDATMLATGPYPAYLKARIAGATGHLDNRDAAAFVRSLVTEAGVTHIFLCHLSQENNTPQRAMAEVRGALAEAGITDIGTGNDSLSDARCRVQLVALPRTKPSPLFILKTDN